MNLRLVIQCILLPNLRIVSAFLRKKDTNSTGADDEAADAIDYTLDKLNKYLEGPV